MYRKLLRLSLSCVVAAGFLIAGGVAMAKEMVTDSLGRRVEKPQYGGMITFQLTHEKATNYFDPIVGGIGAHIGSVHYDKLITADWTKGPTGTGEFSFTSAFVPLKYRTGHLVESWEMKNDRTVILNVRRGVHFFDKPPVNGREMNAHDIVYSFLRVATTPGSGFYTPPKNLDEWIEKKRKANPQMMAAWLAKLKKLGPKVSPEGKGKGYMRALDDWTIEYQLYEPDRGMMDSFGRWYVYAEDCIKEFGDLKDWRNVCGTGAWIPEKVVPARSVTWRRNPNYWMSDPLHPKNKLPYPDKLRGLIIPDRATAIAALRTHKLDLGGTPWDQANEMKKSNPELKFRKYSPTGSSVIFMRTDLAPFKDVRVRQALSLAIDNRAMAEDYFGGNAEILTWPCTPGNVECYTPLEKLPKESRELFEYHPEKAKKLLAAAGYPNGFKASSAEHISDADRNEMCLMVQAYWAEVGVKLECKKFDGAVRAQMIRTQSYPSVSFVWWGNTTPQAVLAAAHGGIPGIIWNFGKVVDDKAEEEFNQWKVTMDPEEASRILKKAYLRQIPLNWEVALPAPTAFGFYAPWLKNFSGELTTGPSWEWGNSERYRYMWVDQKLKAKYVK